MSGDIDPEELLANAIRAHADTFTEYLKHRVADAYNEAINDGPARVVRPGRAVGVG